MTLEPGFELARGALLPWLKSSFNWHIEGSDHLPTVGPAIVAANHISLFDPLAVAYAIYRTGRRPRFLGKESLFDAFFVGWVLRTAKQIRVDRGTDSAVDSLRYAKKAVRQGEVVAIFPEGTVSKSPDLRPLEPKSGVARLALSTGLGVIPCATWGGQWVWGYHVGFKPGLPLRRKDVWVRFGEQIEMKDLSEREDDPDAWREASRRVMERIEELKAPMAAAKPWAPRPLTRRHQRVLIKKGRL